MLRKTEMELKKKYPLQEFRMVAVDFGNADHENQEDYIKTIVDSTNDIEIQIVFNNAGYLVMRGFTKIDIRTHLRNLETNAISHLRITHHFMKKMIENKRKGCIVFTSSPVGFFPSPANVLYGCSKAMLAQFAQCLACEASTYGIDILVANMGPMKTDFYSNKQNVPEIGILDFFFKIQSSADSCADVLLSSIGRIIVRDHSGYTILNRLILKIIDVNLLIRIISSLAPLTADFKKNPDLM